MVDSFTAHNRLFKGPLNSEADKCNAHLTSWTTEAPKCTNANDDDDSSYTNGNDDDSDRDGDDGAKSMRAR